MAAPASPNFPLPQPLKPHKILWSWLTSCRFQHWPLHLPKMLLLSAKEIPVEDLSFTFTLLQVIFFFSYRVTVLSPRKAFLVVSAEQLPTVLFLCPTDQGLLWSPLESSVPWQPPPRHHCCLSFHISRLLSFSGKARHTPACGLHVCYFLSNSYCLFSIIGICLQMLPWREFSKTTYFSHIAPPSFSNSQWLF